MYLAISALLFFVATNVCAAPLGASTDVATSIFMRDDTIDPNTITISAGDPASIPAAATPQQAPASANASEPNGRTNSFISSDPKHAEFVGFWRRQLNELIRRVAHPPWAEDFQQTGDENIYIPGDFILPNRTEEDTEIGGH